MGRTLTNLYLIDGKPIFAPDNEQSYSYEDIDSADAGRTEDGYMHRAVVRYKVGKWEFSYAYITEEDKQYIESLFGDRPTFEFTRPDRYDSTKTVTTTCYRSKYSLSWYNAIKGQWRNYTFNIIEC